MKKISKNKGRALVWVIIVVVIVAGLLWWVAPKSQTQTGPIKIGVVAPLRGDLAQYGVGMKNAIEMAVNDSGLKDKIQLIIEDDNSCSPADDVSAAQKLVNIDKVDAIIGPLCSSSALSMSDITEKNKIFLITPGAAAKTVTMGKKYVFRTVQSDSAGAVSIANLAFDSGYKKVAVFNDASNDAFVQSASDFKEAFKGRGGQIVSSESYLSGDADYRSQLTKIKGASVDALILSGYPKDVGMIVKQARTLRINLPIFSAGSLENQDFINLAGKDAEGVIYPQPKAPTNKESSDFVIAYKKIYNQDPVLYTAESYDATALLIKALMASDKSAGDIKAKIYSLGQNYAGASGIINFEQSGDVNKPMTLMTVRGGKFVEDK